MAHFASECWLSLDQNGWLSLVQNNQSAFDIIDKWFTFDSKSKLELVNCHDTLSNYEEVAEIINYNTMLFHTQKISKVPSVLLNGYPLPGIFVFEDIKYHLNELEKMKNECNEIEVI